MASREDCLRCYERMSESEDPTDWLVFADLLVDASAPTRLETAARYVATALLSDRRLQLLPARDWLRIDETFMGWLNWGDTKEATAWFNVSPLKQRMDRDP